MVGAAAIGSIYVYRETAYMTHVEMERTASSRVETAWRYAFAQQIARQMDMAYFGVKAIYLFGSVATGCAGLCSDIDLILHMSGSEKQKRDLLKWLSVWDAKLREVCLRRSGERPGYMLDIHLIRDEDFEKKNPFAQMTQSVYEPIELLRTLDQP